MKTHHKKQYKKQSVRVALVYDWVDSWGGVERLIHILHEIFPDAPLYTSYYDKKKALWARSFDIRPSFLQYLPEFIRNNRILSLFMFPYAFESFNLSKYDVIFSVSSFAAKAVITKPQQRHISILLTPTRYLWSMPGKYIKHPILQVLSLPCIALLRICDYIMAQRADFIISISQTVQKRCSTYYKRDSTVIYPPFDYEYWEDVQKNQDIKPSFHRFIRNLKSYYLVVSRLEPYKSVDLVRDVFRERPDDNLLIIGKGSQSSFLKKNAPKNIYFYESLTDIELSYVYTYARALIIPQEEDFGYISLEAQICGCPVIAYQKGGVSEAVIPDVSGIFFQSQSIESLQDALERFQSFPYNKKAIMESVKKRRYMYGKEVFIEAIKAFLKEN